MAAKVVIPEESGAAGGASAIRLDQPRNQDGRVKAVDGTLQPTWWKIPTGGALAGAKATVFFS